MEEKEKPVQIAYAAYEAALGRAYSIITRLLIIIALLIAIIAALVWNQMQYETVTTEQTIEAEQGGSGTNIVGGGNVTYGAEGENQDND